MISPSLLLSLILLTAVVVSGEQAPVSVKVPSRVNGTVGRSVILPCTLESPYTEYTTVEIVISWKKKVFYRGPVLFNVTNRSKGSKEFENEVHTNIKGRYKLAGDLRKGNAALELQNATLDDSDQYFCRVEISRQGLNTFKAESNPGITLEILGAPVILRVSVNVINATHSIIECLAEGQPSPSIIWINPHNKRLPVNSSETPVTPGPGKYQILGELHHPKLGGNYTCLAVNEQGNTTQSVQLPETVQSQRPHMLIYIIAVLVGSVILIILLVIGLVILRRRSGRAEINSPHKRSIQPTWEIESSISNSNLTGVNQGGYFSDVSRHYNENKSRYRMALGALVGHLAPEAPPLDRTQPNSSRGSEHLQLMSAVGNRTEENGALEIVPKSDATEESASLTAQTRTDEVNAMENGSCVAVPRTPEDDSMAENASLTAVSLTLELNAAEDSACLTAQTCVPEVNVTEDNGSLAAESLMPEQDTEGSDK